LGGGLVKVDFADPTLRTTFGDGFLNAPGGVAVDATGHVYVSNKSTSAAGTVVRLNP
jgi:hypothetical protein